MSEEIEQDDLLEIETEEAEGETLAAELEADLPASEAATEPKRRGRPELDLNLQKFEALCQIHATDEEMAAHLGCSPKTIQRRRNKDPEFAAIFEKGRADGKISLRRSQYKEALKGNTSMLIWLGKQLLGQRDNIEITGAKGGPVQMNVVRDMLDELTDEDFAQVAKENGIDLDELEPSLDKAA
jgi:hypothetical protein